MTWKSLIPLKLARSDGQATISIQKRAVAIRLGNDILEQTGWEPGTRVDVQIGDGAQAGFLRLSKNRAGWSLQRQGGENGRELYAVLRVNKILAGRPVFPDLPESLPATTIKTTFREGGLEFRLPWVLQFGVDNLNVPAANGKVIAEATFVSSENCLA